MKQIGMHFYINVRNYNDIVEKEESVLGRPLHSIHALDLYFTSIERYAKELGKVEIEKITGSRLHMYIIDDDMDRAFKFLWKVSTYARSLTRFISDKIAKYKTLQIFEIQVGACYGKFYEFEFTKTSEITTIGYAANFAAKLQSIALTDCLCVSENIYNDLTNKNIKNQFNVKYSAKIKKYDQDKYYEIKLIDKSHHFNDKIFTRVIEFANSINLGDINFSKARNLIDLEQISLVNSKEIVGIPFFADIRGFTSQFLEDDSNLEEMKIKTEQVLTKMHDVVIKHNGVHVQFQGDREVAIFHEYGDNKDCYLNSVISGLRLIDQIKEFNISIGIGESAGKMFVTRIGTRGSKDNIIVGRVVNKADEYEDNEANLNELVIDSDIYQKLNTANYSVAKLFKKRNDYYVTSIGFKQYLDGVQRNQLLDNNKNKKYNGAWFNG